MPARSIQRCFNTIAIDEKEKERERGETESAPVVFIILFFTLINFPCDAQAFLATSFFGLN